MSKKSFNPKKSYSRRPSCSESGKRKSTVKINSNWPTDIFIIDDDGNDVTVKPLLHIDDGSRKKQTGFNDSSVESPTEGFSQASFFMTGLGSTQQFTRSVFPKSCMETSELPEDLFQVFESTSDEKLIEPGSILQTTELNEDLQSDNFEICLAMTDMFDCIDMPTSYVTQFDHRAEEIKGVNYRYSKVLKVKAENSDRYEDKGINTFNGALKSKGTQTHPVIFNNKENMATDWDIYDTYNPQEVSDEIPERKLSKISMDDDKTSHASDYGSHVTDTIGFETQTDIFFNKSGVSSVVSHSPSSKNESQYIDINAFENTCRVMESYLSLNNHQDELSRYRDFQNLIFDNTNETSRTHSLSGSTLGILKTTLKKLWKYPQIEGFSISVTSISINPENNDIIAVGYGNLNHGNQNKGLVCCWSLKNLLHPGRKYIQNIGVTAVSFSNENPNLLSVGLVDGSILIYNLRSAVNEPIVSNQRIFSRHHGPIWGLEWVIKSTMDGEVSEMLISTSNDGRVIQWNIKKGLEGYDIMKLKKASERLRHVEPGGQIAKMKKTNYILYRNSECYCFDISPKDPNIYFAGTNEGSIYKCSCSYNEQHISSYIGHTAPVYKIKVSPFMPDIFISAGADWKINLWSSESSKCLLQLNQGTEEFIDLSWCTWNSCVFASVRKNFVEIWDLSGQNTDPIFSLKAINNEKFTAAKFSSNSKCLFVGDSEGGVSVHELINLEIDDNIEANKLNKIVLQLRKNDEMKELESNS